MGDGCCRAELYQIYKRCFLGFAREQIVERRNLEILSFATKKLYVRRGQFALSDMLEGKTDDIKISKDELYVEDVEDMGIPSWVPNWKHTQYAEPMVLFPQRLSAASNVEAEVSIDDDGETLVVKGKIVDTAALISSMGCGLGNAGSKATTAEEQRNNIEETYSNLCRWLLEMMTLALPPNGRLTARSADEMGLTLLFGQKFLLHEERDMADYLLLLTDAAISYEQKGITPEFYEMVDRLREYRPIEIALGMFNRGRRLCKTLGDRLAWVPDSAMPGDSICLFYGAPTAFMLRGTASGTYTLIGEAYLQGFMNGEAVEIDDSTEYLRIR
jgi:hypothetical protein